MSTTKLISKQSLHAQHKQLLDKFDKFVIKLKQIIIEQKQKIPDVRRQIIAHLNINEKELTNQWPFITDLYIKVCRRMLNHLILILQQLQKCQPQQQVQHQKILQHYKKRLQQFTKTLSSSYLQLWFIEQTKWRLNDKRKQQYFQSGSKSIMFKIQQIAFHLCRKLAIYVNFINRNDTRNVGKQISVQSIRSIIEFIEDNYPKEIWNREQYNRHLQYEACNEEYKNWQIKVQERKDKEDQVFYVKNIMAEKPAKLLKSPQLWGFEELHSYSLIRTSLINHYYFPLSQQTPQQANQQPMQTPTPQPQPITPTAQPSLSFLQPQQLQSLDQNLRQKEAAIVVKQTVEKARIREQVQRSFLSSRSQKQSLREEYIDELRVKEVSHFLLSMEKMEAQMASFMEVYNSLRLSEG